MIIVGHKLIKSPLYQRVNSIEDIKSSPSNSVIFFDTIEANSQLANYATNNDVSFAVLVTSSYEALIANSLGAAYIICKDSDITQQIQSLANEYLWSAKILQVIVENRQIVTVANSSIDGVIFEDFLSL